MPISRDILSIWTLYDHPKDYPAGFIARRWEVYATGPVPTDDAVMANDLETLREHFRDCGLYCMPRQPGDDPVIIETWI